MERVKHYESTIKKNIWIALVINVIYVLFDIDSALGVDLFAVVLVGVLYYFIINSVETKNFNRLKTIFSIEYGVYIFIIVISSLGIIGAFAQNDARGFWEILIELMSVIFSLRAVNIMISFSKEKVNGIKSTSLIEEVVRKYTTTFIISVGFLCFNALVKGNFITLFGMVCVSIFELMSYQNLFYWYDAVTEEKFEQVEAEKSVEMSEKVEILKGYKELLDCGIITQEEFEEKKKEIL